MVDLVLLQEERDAVVELPRDGATARNDAFPIHLDGRGIDLDAPVLAVANRLHVELSVVKERLGGNAAPVEADTAQLVALDARSLHAHLRRADRADVSAGAAADDDQVVVLR